MRLFALITCAALALIASGCSSDHVVTCTCCEGTTAETMVCDGCMYIVAPCQSACGAHLAPPMCAASADAGLDSGR